jgi:non-specific serine/threonine protein kinase
VQNELSKPADPYVNTFGAIEEGALDSEALVQLLSRQELSFCICDPSLPDCPVIFVSNGFEALTGYSSAEIIGRNCRFLQGRRTGKAASKQLRNVVQSGGDASVFLLNFKKDGTPFLNSVSLISLKDESGKTVRGMCD